MARQHNQTEPATPRRLEKARREGQYLTSRELVASLQFLTFVLMLSVWGADWFGEVQRVARFVLERAFQASFGPDQAIQFAGVLFTRVLLPLGMAGGLLVAVTLGAQLAITRGGFSAKRLRPTLGHFNPMNKLREIPRQNLATLIQSVVLLAAFGGIIYLVAKENVERFFSLPLAPLQKGLTLFHESLSDLLWKAAGVFLVFGAVDLFRQYRRYRKDMRMSKQDIREEIKESEGNPHTKARIRRLQRDMRRRRMMQEIATATAVVVNPTHYAVAIRYVQDSMAAPVVVAKGKNYLALRIRQRAIEHQVPLVENPPLAQALYKSVDLGQEIPPNLYRAVAEVLAYIHRMLHGQAR
ncbi:MAG: EscU/YscU/HrcU family type III secretion system export apparatus switch protein [Candidatus Solibacter usitatus]|nr:EscU/YscU/HrcU family type III secretion system export apparatus switch protein [Candidatus Solibacter usitatus]